MNVPGFTSEASLYKTSQSYRGPRSRPAGDAASSTVVTLQLDCSDKCALTWQLCNLGCAFASSWLLPFCLAGCGVRFGICLDDCPDGGGGGGGQPSCCPPGKSCKCGGTCVPGMGCVDGVCLGPKQVCP